MFALLDVLAHFGLGKLIQTVIFVQDGVQFFEAAFVFALFCRKKYRGHIEAPVFRPFDKHLFFFDIG